MKRFLLIIALFLFTGAGVAFLMYSNPHRNIAGIEPIAKTSAEMLFKEYVGQPQETNKKYLNKVLLVDGQIESMNLDANGELNIMLSTGELFGISCNFPRKYVISNDLAEGSTIKVKGLCKGYLGDEAMPGNVVLMHCNIE